MPFLQSQSEVDSLQGRIGKQGRAISTNLQSNHDSGNPHRGICRTIPNSISKPPYGAVGIGKAISRKTLLEEPLAIFAAKLKKKAECSAVNFPNATVPRPGEPGKWRGWTLWSSRNNFMDEHNHICTLSYGAQLLQVQKRFAISHWVSSLVSLT